MMRRTVLLVLTIVALCAPAVAVSAGVEPTRSDYVARLEQICKPRSEATTRAVHGTRGDVQAERFRVAARRFEKAKQIYAGTIAAISKVPRPADDQQILSRWFAALKAQTTYLAQSIAALHAENLARFQRISAKFFRQGSKSNNVVISFQFDYCAFKPSRYE